MVGRKRVGVAVVAVLFVGGCSQPDETVAAATALTPTAVSPLLSKSTWTDGVWPLTVPDGVLKCYVEDSMQTFTADGVEYGLNATARRFGNFRDIDEIAPVASPPDYVEVDGTKHPVKTYAVSLDGIYARANNLCSRR